MWDSNVVGLLIIGCLVGGIPGAWAWGVSTATGWARLFQTGPALLILPVFVWSVISYATSSHEVDDWWRRNFYITYAILFVPAFYIFCMLALVLAIRFPL
jgi:hypothetical protein